MRVQRCCLAAAVKKGADIFRGYGAGVDQERFRRLAAFIDAMYPEAFAYVTDPNHLMRSVSAVLALRPRPGRHGALFLAVGTGPNLPHAFVQTLRCANGHTFRVSALSAALFDAVEAFAREVLEALCHTPSERDFADSCPDEIQLLVTTTVAEELALRALAWIVFHEVGHVLEPRSFAPPGFKNEDYLRPDEARTELFADVASYDFLCYRTRARDPLSAGAEALQIALGAHVALRVLSLEAAPGSGWASPHQSATPSHPIERYRWEVLWPFSRMQITMLLDGDVERLRLGALNAWVKCSDAVYHTQRDTNAGE